MRVSPCATPVTHLPVRRSVPLCSQEWGDRSMLATIALAATQSPWGVAVGATAGHAAATAIAVLGGSLLSNRISEKKVCCCSSNAEVSLHRDHTENVL